MICDKCGKEKEEANIQSLDQVVDQDIITIRIRKSKLSRFIEFTLILILALVMINSRFKDTAWEWYVNINNVDFIWVDEEQSEKGYYLYEIHNTSDYNIAISKISFLCLGRPKEWSIEKNINVNIKPGEKSEFRIYLDEFLEASEHIMPYLREIKIDKVSYSKYK